MSTSSTSIDGSLSRDSAQVFNSNGEALTAQPSDNGKDNLHADLDRELRQFALVVSLSSEDTIGHNVILDLVRDVARRVLDPSADIQIFGSAASGLCEKGSDIDATIVIDFALLNQRFRGLKKQPSLTETRALCSEAVAAIAKYVESSVDTGLGVECLIAAAKVPIVVLNSFGRQIIDVSINNVLPTHNTRLLKEYAALDERVRILVLCVKRWAKMCHISDAKQGNLSSYSWTLLCVYYLQTCNDPILPSLQGLAHSSSATSVIYNCPSSGRAFDVGYCTSSVVKSLGLVRKNNLSISEVLRGFFTFYDKQFKWGQEVVSVRLGKRANISDQQFASLPLGSRAMQQLPVGVEKIHIEDPLDLQRNLHCVMDVEGLVRLRKAFSDISNRITDAPMPVLIQQARLLTSYNPLNPSMPFTPQPHHNGTAPVKNVTTTPVIRPANVVAASSPTPMALLQAEAEKRWQKSEQMILQQASQQQQKNVLPQNFDPLEIVKQIAAGMSSNSSKAAVNITPQTARPTNGGGNNVTVASSGYPGRGSYLQRIANEDLWRATDMW